LVFIGYAELVASLVLQNWMLSMEHLVLCLLTYTFISDLLFGLAKIVDCFHSCYPFVDKLYSSFFSVCLARSGRPVEPCIQCSCAVGNICGSESIESYDI